MPMRTKCAVVDNYDSFTYNLVHMIKELGADVTVLRNDRFDLMDLMPFDRIVLSPGPGIPSEAGLLLDVIRRYAGIRPILGVCLGHQAIGEVFGARLLNLSDVFHGVSAKVTQVADTPLFAGLPQKFPVGRYHSWVVERESMPDCLEITAESDEGLIMALHHRTYDIHGIQFHPESVLTPDGKRIMENWLHI
ncbi:MAG: anthranilate synthase component II [Prevotella denticola]